MMPVRLVPGLVFLAVAHARTWPVDGIVIAADPVARTILVSHRPIANYMPAMAMPFRVEDGAQLKNLHPGDRVTLTQRSEGTFDCAERPHNAARRWCDLTSEGQARHWRASAELCARRPTRQDCHPRRCQRQDRGD